jgi:isoleucyl-tRNA synthetase
MKLREEASRLLENARKEKIIGSSLEGAIALTVSDALERDRRATGTVGPRLADLFIVSEATTAESVAAGGDWTPSATYPGLSLRFEKARGRRCDRCWKVTPEAEADGLCDRCREVLQLRAGEPAGVVQ